MVQILTFSYILYGNFEAVKYGFIIPHYHVTVLCQRTLPNNGRCLIGTQFYESEVAQLSVYFLNHSGTVNKNSASTVSSSSKLNVTPPQ